MGASRTVRSTFGWVDSKSGEPVDDKDIKGKYQQDIITHAGVRLIGMTSFVCAL